MRTGRGAQREPAAPMARSEGMAKEWEGGVWLCWERNYKGSEKLLVRSWEQQRQGSQRGGPGDKRVDTKRNYYAKINGKESKNC